MASVESKSRRRSSQSKSNTSEGAVSRDKRSGLVVPEGYSPSHKKGSKDSTHNGTCVLDSHQTPFQNRSTVFIHTIRMST
jgi:hypothetical protein